MATAVRRRPADCVDWRSDQRSLRCHPQRESGQGGEREAIVARSYRYRPIGLIFLLYVIIGLVVAFQRHYITVALLKGVVSALLAVFLWFLVLLGIDLHIR
jgi:hypothetical protein